MRLFLRLPLALHGFGGCGSLAPLPDHAARALDRLTFRPQPGESPASCAQVGGGGSAGFQRYRSRPSGLCVWTRSHKKRLFGPPCAGRLVCETDASSLTHAHVSIDVTAVPCFAHTHMHKHTNRHECVGASTSMTWVLHAHISTKSCVFFQSMWFVSRWFSLGGGECV